MRHKFLSEQPFSSGYFCAINPASSLTTDSPHCAHLIFLLMYSPIFHYKSISSVFTARNAFCLAICMSEIICKNSFSLIVVSFISNSVKQLCLQFYRTCQNSFTPYTYTGIHSFCQCFCTLQAGIFSISSSSWLQNQC